VTHLAAVLDGEDGRDMRDGGEARGNTLGRVGRARARDPRHVPRKRGLILGASALNGVGVHEVVVVGGRVGGRRWHGAVDCLIVETGGGGVGADGHGVVGNAVIRADANIGELHEGVCVVAVAGRVCKGGLLANRVVGIGSLGVGVPGGGRYGRHGLSIVVGKNRRGAEGGVGVTDGAERLVVVKEAGERSFVYDRTKIVEVEFKGLEGGDGDVVRRLKVVVVGLGLLLLGGKEVLGCGVEELGV
jgi:hypothetical protein